MKYPLPQASVLSSSLPPPGFRRFGSALLLLAASLLLPGAVRAQCTNCTTTTVGSDVVHTFTVNGTFTPPAGVTAVQYLVVGGGAGGGGVTTGGNFGGGGGGGAGGYRTAAGFAVTPLTVYNITVGAGGTEGVGGASQGGTGGNSSFSTITANGGGGGATSGVSNNGVNGASGGGSRVGGTPGTGIAGQGNAGGDSGNAGGGGGGSAAVGADGGAATGGAGGTGTVNNITGANVTYAAGGAGGNYGTRAAGAAGTANTGNGGGGAAGANGGTDFNGGTGGSGIVIIRYPLHYYSRSSGNWTGTDRWSVAGCGGATAGTAEPGIGNHVTICNGDVITLDTSIGGAGLLSMTINAGGELQMANNNTARTLTVGGDITNSGSLNIPTNRDTTSTLSLSGDIVNNGTLNFATDANSLVNTTFTGGGAHTISGTGTVRFNNLTVNNSLTINKAAGAVTQAGTLSVVANLTLQSGTLNLGATTTIGGNLVNNDTLAPGTGTVTLNGAAAQTISGTSGNTSFNNLTLNNANGLSLSGTHNITVNATATLTSGRITTASNHVYIASGNAIAGASATNFVVGNLRKAYPTGNQTRVFEVGSVSGGVLYAPVTLQLGDVTGAGDFTVTTTAGDHPNIATSTLDSTLSINRYWTLSNNSIAFAANAGTAVTFTYNNAADYDAGADFNEFYVGNYNGAWTEYTPGTRTTTTTVISGVTLTSATLPGDYQIGQKFVPSFTCPSGETFLSGLLGSYYDYTGQTFPAPPQPTGTATGTRVDGPVDFNWAAAAPGVTGIGINQFAVRWDGALNVTATGTYQFQTVSDDGVRLWINDTLIINNWTDHAATTNTSGNVQLTAGKTYEVRLEFYENGGSAEIRLRWGPSGGPFVAIPAGPTPTPALGQGLYYCESTEPGGTIVAYYRMDEDNWTGAAGEIEDESGNGNHASRIGTPGTDNTSPARTGDPGTCGYGTIPVTAGTQAVDTGIDLDTLGNAGSITFWYNSNTDWDDGNDRMLFDASNNLGNGNADKHFYLVKGDTGRLRFAVEDSSDNDDEARDATSRTFAAGTWHHIGVTWDIGTDVLRLYIDGTQVATSGATANSLGNTATLYLGDQRMANVQNTPGDYSTNSANGSIDEVRIYSSALTATDVLLDWLATHPCIDAPHHLQLEHGSGSSLTCNSSTLTVRACADAACSTFYTEGVTGTLTATGAPTVNWTGGAGFTIPSGSSTVNKTFQVTTGGTTVLGTSGVTPTPSNATDCNFGSPVCTFTAADTGFIFDVPNHIADVLQNVTVSAVRTDDTTQRCVPAFQNATKAVNFWSTYTNPNTGTQAVAVNGTNVAGAGPGTAFNLNFDNNGEVGITVRYPDVGQMQLNARHTGSGDAAGLIMNGQDIFITRPDRFALTIPGNPAAAGAGGGVFTRAGQPFEITVEARNASNAITPNYGRETSPETVDLTKILVLPGGGNDPNLSGSFGDFGEDCDSNPAAAGTACGTFSWPEVGIITLTPDVGDDDYLGTGNVTGTASGNIGRFIPNHFTLNGGTLTPRIDIGCGASAFTYMGENLQLGFTLTAHAVGGGTTQNYTGAFAKLNPTSATDLRFRAIDTLAPTVLTGRIGTGAITGAWTNGVTNVLAPVTISRGATPDGPYQNLRIGAAPLDSDTVALDSSTLDLDADNNTVADSKRINPANADVRYGRLFMENAFGSELMPLTIPIRAEYYSGTQFVLNSLDSCTSYDFNNVAITNRQGLMTANPTVSGTGTLDMGVYRLTDTPIQLTPPPSTPIQVQTGSVDATLTVPDYLKYDWDNNNVTPDQNPTSKATFGIYGGPEDNQIYIREVY